MNERGDLLVYADAGAVALALAEYFVATGELAIAERGKFTVALSGGNTPRAAYELLAAGPLCASLSWNDVFIYFGDERCVPPGDERSNYRMAREAFLDAVPIPSANVARMRGEIDPGLAANEYASILRASLGELPRLDLVMLGLGEDGHTASLFPGIAQEIEGNSLVEAAYAQSQAMWRLTMTPKVINAARRVVFAVEGAAKARALAAVYEGPRDPITYPAQLVQPSSGELRWLVDEAAAELLRLRARLNTSAYKEHNT
ncbi:MAG: 6-phosphogluconolactonase [Candidatus Cybelea sp.]